MLDTARGLAAFFGIFTLLNLAGVDANVWWIDLWPVPAVAGRVILVLFGVAMLLFAIKPRAGRPRRALSTALIAIVTLASIANTVRYYVVLLRGDIKSRFPLPLSLVIAATMLILFIGQYHDRKTRKTWVAVVTFVVAGIVFPLLQISLYGLTDYRRPADLIVVFGARAYADGRPSDALADRVRTGCRLYTDGLAPRLLFSGGPGDGKIDEPEAMRRMAVTLGVPDSAIIRDPHGLNTEATVIDTKALAGGATMRVLAVSHFYHLPRIKMTYQRHGMDEVFTVPAEHNTQPWLLPLNIAREDAAFWRYYLRRWV